MLLFAITFINFLRALPRLIFISSQSYQKTNFFWIFRHDCVHTLFIKYFFPRKYPNRQAIQYYGIRGINQTIFTQSLLMGTCPRKRISKLVMPEEGNKNNSRQMYSSNSWKEKHLIFLVLWALFFFYVAHINGHGSKNRF